MNKLLTGAIIMATAISANGAALTDREAAIVDIGAATARGEYANRNSCFTSFRGGSSGSSIPRSK